MLFYIWSFLLFHIYMVHDPFSTCQICKKVGKLQPTNYITITQLYNYLEYLHFCHVVLNLGFICYSGAPLIQDYIIFKLKKSAKSRYNATLWNRLKRFV